MNKKAFVLMETIVVIVVISVALLTIFSSYNKILTKVKTENKYDTSEYIYMTEYIKKYLDTKTPPVTTTDIFPCTYDIDNTITGCQKLTLTNLKEDSMNLLNVEKIYVLTDINKFDAMFENSSESSQDGTKPSEYFDAYMIDYIRKLDVSDTDKLIIVEYKREALNTDGTPKTVFNNNANALYETYIASLEWEYDK